MHYISLVENYHVFDSWLYLWLFSSVVHRYSSSSWTSSKSASCRVEIEVLFHHLLRLEFEDDVNVNGAERIYGVYSDILRTHEKVCLRKR